MTVKLIDANGVVAATTTTDANGDYSFGNLAVGDYSVMVVAPDGQEFTLQDVGSDDNDDSDVDANGMSGTVSVTAGGNVKVDAGLKDAPQPGSLSGTYFMDANRDGADNDNMDVAGKEVKLLNADGSPATDIDGNPVAAVLTDADGDYSFGNLAAGDYVVMFEDSAAEGKEFIAQDAADDADDSDVNPANGMTAPVTVNEGQNTPNVDAGVQTLPGSLSGTYFVDENENGADDDGIDVADKQVKLLNADGSPASDIDGNPVAPVQTDANGNYSFGNLAPGEYKVMFEAVDGSSFIAPNAADDADDSDVTSGTMTDPVTVNAGANTPNVDAGISADPIPGSLSGTYFFDNNDNNTDDAGDGDVSGKQVKLLNPDGSAAVDFNGNPVAPVQTDSNGNYSFANLAAGAYVVMFAPTDGASFVTPGQGDEADDSDVDGNGMTAPVTVNEGENTPNVDAGVSLDNQNPTAADDDAGEVCANEEVCADVLANDNDADGDTLTITSVDGQAIQPGGSVTTASGVIVTLDDATGELCFDGETAYESLDIGQSETEEISYTVSDGNGGEATATVSVTFKGVAEDAEDIGNSIAGMDVKFQITNGYESDPLNDGAYTVKLSGTGDVRFDDLVIEDAYCLSGLDDVLSNPAGTDIDLAPMNMGNFYLADGASVPAGDLATTGLNGASARDNLDEINWIINQDFGSQGFTDMAIQGAIWMLTDGDNPGVTFEVASPLANDGADVEAIYDLAVANGSGFEAGSGDLVGLYIDPTADTEAAGHVQPFLVAVAFDDIDCLC